jgi:hypothetical protein
MQFSYRSKKRNFQNKKNKTGTCSQGCRALYFLKSPCLSNLLEFELKLIRICLNFLFWKILNFSLFHCPGHLSPCPFPFSHSAGHALSFSPCGPTERIGTALPCAPQGAPPPWPSAMPNRRIERLTSPPCDEGPRGVLPHCTTLSSRAASLLFYAQAVISTLRPVSAEPPQKCTSPLCAASPAIGYHRLTSTATCWCTVCVPIVCAHVLSLL